MFRVLKIDGPNIVTDKGGIQVVPFQYADGGKTQSVSQGDWQAMRDAFCALPDLLAACEAFLRAPSIGSSGPGSVTIEVTTFNLEAARAAIAKARGKVGAA
jgi:hypothetical protein